MAETRERVRELTEAGYTPRQIARALDVSTQAVYQHLKRIRAEETEAA